MFDITADIADLKLDFLPAAPQGVYLVGGTVRDLLMGLAPADIDLVIGGDIVRAAETIAEKTAGRIVDLGKKGFAVLRVASSAAIIDITPLEGPTIEADLEQRDFTINALAYDMKAKRLVDCTGGLSDLRQKTIRMVSPSAFTKDPARLVRAYRMAATFDCSIAAETREAIQRHGHLVSRVAGERVWSELLKLLHTADSAPVVRSMATDGLLTSIFPELQATVGCAQSLPHQFDVFEHSLRAYATLETLLQSAASRFADLVPSADLADLSRLAPLLKLAALLHDVGKPATRRVDADGRVRFRGHAAQSAAITATISRRLRLSRQQRETADAIIRHHVRPLFLFLATQNGNLGRRGMVRFFTRCGALTLPIIVHAMGDIMAKSQVLQGRDSGFIAFCDRLIAAYGKVRDRQRTGPPLINGNDLIAVFSLSPSPRFKEILRRVDERRLTGELTTRDQALAWVGATLSSVNPNS